jgi:hypothetical protein
MKRPFLYVCRGTGGRDRWMIGAGTTIRWAWSMPRWLSFKSLGWTP